jgi:hypothetical protein
MLILRAANLSSGGEKESGSATDHAKRIIDERPNQNPLRHRERDVVFINDIV